MKKRKDLSGQTTIFIIIAILIVVIIAFIVIFSKLPDGGNINPFKNEISLIKDSIIKCSMDNARQGVKRIGLQGGYFNKPNYSEELGWAFIPYYYYEGNIYLPNKTFIEQEIGSYVDFQMGYCLQEIFSENYQLEYAKSKTTSVISPGKIKIIVDLPVSIKKAESVTLFELNSEEIVFNSSLYEIYEVADYITKSHIENDTLFCASCVVEMAKERNLYVDLIDYKDSTTLVMLSENWSYKEPYLFEFLNKY
ncbi:hypothetical protein J4218_04630 [Candidatus Pacearchaeota archaeon]|nr:hypothetical protein [Candidatus Pacearchaeota archaeon]